MGSCLLLDGLRGGLLRRFLLFGFVAEGYAAVLFAVHLKAAEHARALHLVRPSSSEDQAIEGSLDRSEDEGGGRRSRGHGAALLLLHALKGSVAAAEWQGRPGDKRRSGLGEKKHAGHD